jgi:hypothetical protein
MKFFDVYASNVTLREPMAPYQEDSRSGTKVYVVFESVPRLHAIWVQLEFTIRLSENKFAFRKLLVPKVYRQPWLLRLKRFLRRPPTRQAETTVNVWQDPRFIIPDPTTITLTPFYAAPRPYITTGAATGWYVCPNSVHGLSLRVRSVHRPGMLAMAHRRNESVTLRVSVNRVEFAGVNVRAQWQVPTYVESMPRFATGSAAGCVEFYWILSLAQMDEVAEQDLVCVLCAENLADMVVQRRDVQHVDVNLHAVAASLLNTHEQTIVASMSRMCMVQQ